MVSIIASALIAAAGAYLVFASVAEGMNVIGWLLLVVGGLGLVGNLYLRSRGIGSPRRRR